MALEQEGEAEVVVGLEEFHVGQEWRKLGEVVVVWAGSAGFQNLPSPCHCQDCTALYCTVLYCTYISWNLVLDSFLETFGITQFFSL